MKILIVTPYFYPATYFGGPVTNTYALAKAYARCGHKVTVFTTNAKDFSSNMQIEKEKKQDENLTIYYFNCNLHVMTFNISFSLFFSLIRRMKEFDVVYVNSYRQYSDLAVYGASLLNGCNYVLTSRGSIITDLGELGKFKFLKDIYDIVIGKKIIKKSRKIIALTESHAKEFLELGAKKEQISVIPNGIEPFTYSSGLSIREKYGIDKSAFILLYIGRLHHAKGIQYIVEAISLIETNNIHLFIAGPDFGYEKKLRSMIARLSLENKVHLLGVVSGKTKESVIYESDVVIYPSLFELFPVSPLEGASAGKPVIISKDFSYAKIFEDENAGILIDPTNVMSLSEAIRSLMNKDLCMKMGVNAKNLVIKKFVWKNVVMEHIQEYEKIILK